jgi:ATP-dependent exoDNAse (exonuclease V) alpha subunit
MTQKDALNLLKLGHNVYLTGPAGSGKTHLLNQYIDYLKQQKVSVGITASTGIAATHMGGSTIHSWSGMGIRDTIATPEIHDLMKRSYLRKRFLLAKVLIIDEVSMLHAHQLDIVDAICRGFKRNYEPFGGMQVIMCGDFFQLPPVVKGSDKPSYVTDAEVWNNMRLQICYLDEQFRQSDRSFLRVLSDIRSGQVNEDTVEVLSERLDKEPVGYSKPTKLFTHNADVDAINKKELDELKGEPHDYLMVGRGSPKIIETLRKSCLAPERLTLKIGAQVMFVKNNWDVGYVNGTLGEVIGFDKEDHPKVRTFDGAEIIIDASSWEVKEENVELAAISQIPLRLAWAITVHKSQGMSLDAAEVDLSRSFVPGQGYVALSRLRNLSGLKLMGMNNIALTVNPDIAEVDRDFLKRSDEAMIMIAGMDREKMQKMQEDYLIYLKR